MLQKHHHGIYCRNDTSSSDVALTAVILYHIADAGIAIALMTIFIVKLNKLLKYLKGDAKNEKQMKQWMKKKGIKHSTQSTANEQKQDRKTQLKLLKLVKKCMTLTIISVISSWIIIFGGRIDSQSATPLRWCYPLDYLFNAWCIFLLFEWNEFKWCDCECFENKYIETPIQSENTANTTTLGIGSVDPLSTDDNQVSNDW